MESVGNRTVAATETAKALLADAEDQQTDTVEQVLAVPGMEGIGKLVLDEDHSEHRKA